MAYTTISNPTEYFNTVLYSGTGSEASITGLNHEPGLVWFKKRSATEHHFIYDQLRGALKKIAPSNANAESTETQTLKSFDSDGFTLGTSAEVNGGSTTYVAWSWKGGSSNTSISASGSGDGYINAATVRANPTSGISIVQYTGANSQISNYQHTKLTHGLGAKPDMIWTKETGGSDDWIVGLTTYNDGHLHFNSTDARSGADFTGNWNTSDATHFSLGNDSKLNNNGDTYIAYIFKAIRGYSSFGEWTGNGSSDGNFIYTGFRPAFVLFKDRANNGANWVIHDDKRDTSNPVDTVLKPSATDAESTSTFADFVANGFKVRANFGTGSTFIYAAFAAAPLIGSNGVPANAT